MTIRYQELGIIDRGHPGVVLYKVLDNDNQRIFALKRICLASDDESRSSEWVEREVKILRKLKCSHLVTCYDAFYNDTQTIFSIVTDYCEGGNLGKHIACKKMAREYFTVEEVMHWFVQISVGLSYLHANEILHRDLKPTTIFLTNRNIIKLGEFGVSKCLDNFLDLLNSVVGAPFYQSPEACNFEKYSSKCDVWSLGCVLYELIALEPAFYLEHSAKGVLDKVKKGHYKVLPGQVPSAMSRLIDQLLSANYSKRPSISDVLKNSFVQEHINYFHTLAEENSLERSQRDCQSAPPDRPVSRMSRIQTPRPRPHWSASGSTSYNSVTLADDNLSDLIDCQDDSDSEPDSDSDCSESESDEDECDDTENWDQVLDEARQAISSHHNNQSSAVNSSSSATAATINRRTSNGTLQDHSDLVGSCIDQHGNHICATFLQKIFEKPLKKS